ncbi:hypothetical protein ACLKA6_016204 [Drosophila palustris]
MEDATSENKSAKESSLNVETARLSDVDDISDIEIEDVADELHKTMSAKPVYNHQKSIFNTTLDLSESPTACQQIEVALAAYKEHVVQEKQAWETFITRNLPRSGPQSTSSCYEPSQDHRAYLNKGPNLQQFIRNFSAFMNDSNSFLMEFRDMQDLVEDLKVDCQLHVRNIQRNNMLDCLSKF